MTYSTSIHPIAARACRATLLTLLTLAAVAVQSAHAVDTSCKSVAKAGEAALANSRMHQGLYMPVLVKGVRPAATAEAMLHFIVIDKTAYTWALKGIVDSTPIATPADKRRGAYYAVMLADMDSDCRSLGKATLSGRPALVFENGTNKKPDDILFKIWIDAATGLPLRADLDEGAVEVTFNKGKDGLPVTSAKKGEKRQVNSVVYLFGDAVKPPAFGPKKGMLGTPATLDPQAMAAMLALLN